MIDNEPDWADKHPLGYRPNRKQNNRRWKRPLGMLGFGVGLGAG